MKKNTLDILSYYLGLIIFPILAIVIVILSLHSIPKFSRHVPLNASNFIAKAETLNLNIEDFRYNNEQVTKSIKADNEVLLLKFIECNNEEQAKSIFNTEYNNNTRLQRLLKENEKKVGQSIYEGKNYKIKAYSTIFGTFAYIRIDNTYLEINSKDNDVFRNAIDKLGYKNLLPKTTIILLIVLACTVPYCVFAYFAIPIASIFKKANIHPTIAFIPMYYKYFLCKIAGDKGWKMLLLHIPIVSMFYRLILSLKLAKVFNKSELYGVGIFFLPLFMFPILAYGKSEYNNSSESNICNKKEIALALFLCIIICSTYIIILK